MRSSTVRYSRAMGASTGAASKLTLPARTWNSTVCGSAVAAASAARVIVRRAGLPGSRNGARSASRRS